MNPNENEVGMSEMEGELRSCRFCHSVGTSESELCSPCKCSGTIKYVHNNCLLGWLKERGMQEHPCCEVCSTVYRFHKVYGYKCSISANWSLIKPILVDAEAVCVKFFKVLHYVIDFVPQSLYIGYSMYKGCTLLLSLDMNFESLMAFRFASVIIAFCGILCLLTALFYRWRWCEARNEVLKVFRLTQITVMLGACARSNDQYILFAHLGCCDS